MKSSLSQTLVVSRCFYTTLYNILQIQFWRFFFTPPFITFFTRHFTPVGKSLHEQRSHQSHLFPPLFQGPLLVEHWCQPIRPGTCLVPTLLGSFCTECPPSDMQHKHNKTKVSGQCSGHLEGGGV